MSLPALDTITGALLIGTWANSFLYMAELMQARYYFRHFKHDDWKLKTFVSVAFLVDTVSTVGDYACVYLLHAGDPVYLADQNWGIPLYLFTTAIIAILVQSFLVVRYWWLCVFHLSTAGPLKNIDLAPENILVALLNCFLIIVAFGGSMTVGVIIAMFPAFRERDKVKIPATIWLVTEAVADLSIAAAMLWELRKARPTLNESRSVLDRLVALTIRTGTASATLADPTVAANFRFLLRDDNNVSVGIAYTLGRVYVLSMLANLNVRRSGRSASLGTDEMSSPAGLDTLTFPSSASTDEFRSGLYTFQVDIDPKQDVTLTGTVRSIHMPMQT
ncbi:hypothetical protein B0H14DRAFT_3063613 [Mycena olivaceomarginata]|nr:hypothetical protein B0H14DRAFT_3063613 [Mycena olivaceomarginata]